MQPLISRRSAGHIAIGVEDTFFSTSCFFYRNRRRGERESEGEAGCGKLEEFPTRRKLRQEWDGQGRRRELVWLSYNVLGIRSRIRPKFNFWIHPRRDQ
jgi:hypothetical protein